MVQGIRKQKRCAGSGLALLTMLSAGAAGAAILTVPTQHPTVAAALTAAVSGDEIRVRYDHIEASHSNVVSGKNLIVRSFDSAYTAQVPGAQWILASGGGGVSGGLVLLQNAASFTLEGFSTIRVPGGNAFVAGTSSTLTVSDCNFTGIVLANTAAIKADAVSGVTVTVNDSAFSANGRSIWFNNVNTSSSLNVTGADFSANTSYPIEFRTMAGSHSLNMSRCSIAQATNSPTRLYFFGTAGGATTNNNVSIDRCSFSMSGTAATPVILGGVTSAASASSTADVVLTNCVIDLRSAAASAAGVGCLTDQPNRKGDVTLRHCTIVTANAAQAGIYQFGSTNPGAWEIRNSIISGAGTALKNDGPGTITSGINLFNTTAGARGGTTSGSITLSGSEIIGQSPRFMNSAAGNFRLLPDSPALDVAADLGDDIDIEGNARPFGDGFDLGAYERSVVAGAQSWTQYQ